MVYGTKKNDKSLVMSVLGPQMLSAYVGNRRHSWTMHNQLELGRGQ